MTDFYTGKGDSGSTGVLASGRLPKDDPAIEAIGDVDELNSAVGIAIFYTRDEELRRSLKMMQNELFILGAELASLQGGAATKVRMGKEYVERLEQEMNRINEKVPQLKKFVIPGGCEGAVHLQHARAIARRAERHMVASYRKYRANDLALKYINRASSYLFAAAIYLNYTEGVEESHPTY